MYVLWSLCFDVLQLTTHMKAYLILAVVLGAALGHFVFGSHFDINAALAGPIDSKGMSCH